MLGYIHRLVITSMLSM
uniref:Uncharacterized protein n=1 Tax=Arundo donax TaxID=35708 RepID=A0A0A9CC99_ARUDO